MKDWRIPEVAKNFTRDNVKKFYDKDGKLIRQEEKIGRPPEFPRKKVTYYGKSGNVTKTLEEHSENGYVDETIVIEYNNSGKVIMKEIHTDAEERVDKYCVYDETGERALIDIEFTERPVYDGMVVNIMEKYLDGKTEEEFVQEHPEYKEKIENIKNGTLDSYSGGYSCGYLTAEEISRYHMVELVFYRGEIAEKTCGDKKENDFVVTSYDDGKVSKIEEHFGDQVITRKSGEHEISEIKDAISDRRPASINGIRKEISAEMGEESKGQVI